MVRVVRAWEKVVKERVESARYVAFLSYVLATDMLFSYLLDTHMLTYTLYTYLKLLSVLSDGNIVR